MTQILEKAWNKVIKLPEDRQEFFAHMILDEIKDETKWNKQFENSAKELSILSEKVRKDIKEGKILKKGFGEI